MSDHVNCPTCGGHGADPLSDNLNWRPCYSCSGTGQVTAQYAAHLRHRASRDHDPFRASSPRAVSDSPSSPNPQ